MLGKKRPDVAKRNSEQRGDKHPNFGCKRPDVAERNRIRSGINSPTFGRRGEACQNAKLTQAQADEIRFRLSQGSATVRELAVEFGVSRFTIARIRDGIIYTSKSDHHIYVNEDHSQKAAQHHR
jgi:hypothetical protein